MAIRHGMGNSKVSWWNNENDKKLNIQLVKEFETTAADLLNLDTNAVVRENPIRFIGLDPNSLTVSAIANFIDLEELSVQILFGILKTIRTLQSHGELCVQNLKKRSVFKEQAQKKSQHVRSCFLLPARRLVCEIK